MKRGQDQAGCPDLERLKTFVDGELSPAETTAVREHVDGCRLCAAEATIMRRIGEGLTEMAGSVEPPAGLRERLLSRLPEPRPARPAWGLPRWGQALAATGLAVLVVAMFMPVFARSREAARMVSNQRGAAPASAPAIEMAPSEAAGGEMDAVGGGRMRAAAPVTPSTGQSYGGSGVTTSDIEKYVRGAEGDVVERKVIQTADLSVQVKTSLEAAEKAVTQHVVSGGGYVESSQLTTAEDGERRAQLALRVPVARFEATVAWLGDLGEVKAKRVSGEDVTGRYIDQRALVRELRLEERILVSRLHAAKKAADRDAIRWELVRLRSRIRGAEERLAATAKMAALSSIQLSLVQPRPGATGAGLVDDAVGFFHYAAETFMWALRIPLVAAIWVIVFAPLWIPALVAYRWLSRRAAL